MNKSWEGDGVYKNFVYLNNLLSRKLYEIFEKSFKTFDKTDESKESTGTELKKYFQGMLRHDYYLDTNQQHNSSESVYQKCDSLVEFFLQNMIRGLFDFKVHKNMHAFEKDSSLLKSFSHSFDFDKFIKSIDSNDPDSLLIEIIFREFNLLQDIDFEMNLNELLKLIEKHEKEFSHQFNYDIYLNLENLLAFKIYEDGCDYNNFRLKIIKDKISKRLYNHDKKNMIMPLRLFINCVNLSIKTKDFDYIPFLVDNYLNLLPSGTRKSALYYTNAQLEFVKGNFQKSLEFVSKVDYDIIQMRKHVKNSTLILYYELGYTDSAESLMISYRKYLERNNGFIGMYGEWYDNFLKYYGVLIRLSKNDKEEIAELKRKLEKTVKVLFKSWLLEKLS
jgi:hypothetical protein